MKEAQFYWGPFARACYIAAWWFCLFFVWVAPNVLWTYIPVLIFLGVGLRPLLEATGLYTACQAILLKRDDAYWAKANSRHRKKVEQEERSKRLKQQRLKDERLPKDW
ncbi:hypothetical protein [Pseudoteredinibacter isoporae]|uniref:hypothetical protein n=1 Tax=Pseudoteredinibacter isoporae TaxID=570281 RepID=UPI003103E867